MKIPKRISEILRRKQEFIDLQRDKLEATVVRLQSQLFSDIISAIVPLMDTKDGVILDTATNYKIISTLDKTYREFQGKASSRVLRQIIKTTDKIRDLSEDYFAVVIDQSQAKRFEKIVIAANKLINLRIGLNGGKFIRRGFLECFFNSPTIGMELKQLTSKAVTGGVPMREYVKALKETIGGFDGKSGTMERLYQRYAYDLYQQYDAAYNLILGNEFGFTYFVYQGGLIRDSRDFCAAHDNKVWHRDETEAWKEWTPADGEYPQGWEIKQKDIYSIPSYIDYPGYDPMIDRGGYNCRHGLGWIPDELAHDLRPELKNVT